MPVSIFENSRDETLYFTIDPSGQEHHVPPLARIGVRYAFKAGAPERTHASYSECSIIFWCDASDIEVQILHPTAFDRLLWQLCPTLGFCGGIVNGEPTHVTGLLPAAGTVTARQFALMAMTAEGYGDDESAARERRLPRLEALFCEHMGSDRVPAGQLVRNLGQPFD